MPWAPEYVTLLEFREYVRLHAEADDLDDDILQDALTGASRAIDSECQRQFGNSGASEERFYVPRWSTTRRAWMVATDDIPVRAGLLVHVDSAHDGTFSTEILSTKYLLRPSNADKLGKPWEGLLFSAPDGIVVRESAEEVRITAPAPTGFGWLTVPRVMKLASKLQANRFLTRRDAPFGVAGSPDQGGELRLLAKVDPDVAVMLKNYRRRVKLR